MIIYLFGPDSYSRQKRLSWYSDKFKEKHSALTVENFNLEEASELSRLKDFSTAQSLFDNFKFGILDNVSEAEPKDLEDAFNLSKDSKILTLAISVDKALPKDYKILKDKSVIQEEFKSPSGEALTGFIKKEAQKKDLKLSSDQIRNLARNYSNNQWAVITELDRLALGGSQENLKEEHNFFALVSKLGYSSSSRQSLPILEKLLSQNNPAMVFNVLASVVKDRDAKTKMADLDSAIKSGKLDFEEALLSAILV